MIVHVTLGKLKLNKSNGIIYVVDRLAAFQSTGHDVEVWGISDSTFLSQERKYILRVFKRSLFKIISIKLIQHLLKNKNNIEIFHFHGGWNLEFIFLALLLKCLNKPYFISPHGAFNSEIFKNKNFLKLFFFNTVIKYYLVFAHKVQLYSNREMSFLKNKISKVNCCIIPNGIHPDFSVSKITYKKSSKIIFGYCGRLQNKHKAINKLVQGYAKFKQNNSIDSELWIIGDGEDREDLEKLVNRFNLNKEIIFFGSKYGAEKISLLKKIDSFLLMSNYEGMPISVLEAAALGKFLIVNEATNMSDYIIKYQTGLSIIGNSVNEISSALSEYLEKKLKRDDFNEFIFLNNMKMVKKEFDWKIISNKYINEYR